MDDHVLAVPNDRQTQLLDIFNGFNTNIQFTLETESNGTVPFFDTVLIMDASNKIIIDGILNFLHLVDI